MANLNQVQGSPFSPWRYVHQSGRFAFLKPTIQGTTPAWRTLGQLQSALVEDAMEHCDALASKGHWADADAVSCYAFGA